MRISDAEFYRLKAAMKDLVQHCGGQKRAAEIVGLAQSMVSYICTRENRAMFSPFAVFLLERECGDPIVTRASAELQGFALSGQAGGAVPIPANPFAAIAAIGVEFGDLISGFSQRTTDGDFSPADGLAADRDLADLIARAEAMRRYIAKQASGGAA